MFFESWKSIEKPVLFVTDLGTSPESVQSLTAMQETATVIVIDHHPPYQGFPRSEASMYLNSWDLGADSDFTAGLLSCLLSEVLCKTDVEDLKDASLVCDYSVYARDDETARKNGLVLDFMTFGKPDSVSPAGMDAVLTNSEKRDELFARASRMQEEAIEEGIRRLKKYRSRDGVNVFVLDFGHIARLRLEFPPLGRFCSTLQRRLEDANDSNAVTVVYSLSNISIRVGGDVAGKVGLLEAIARIKSAVDYAVSGGGHMKAAGISVESSRMKETVDVLLSELGVDRS
jgi:RecJ-like exonuclease